MESLLAAARSTQDPCATCNCIEMVAATTSGIDYGRANELLDKCDVSKPHLSAVAANTTTMGSLGGAPLSATMAGGSGVVS
ncbi:hypothetical protein Cni_G07043 [Canna indica]|uniref:Uncharacterized protein n=1 Tax=Canna indica TaxID=4628 RepID=A0AAQ3Q703_9LILI|nr:hypothetical protein Cni_G07043 [Canna indica]